MKIGIFSDLHSNFQALEAMLPTSPVDQWICLGDFVGLFPRVNEVVEKLRENSVLCIQGDHERALLQGDVLKNSVTATEAIQRQRKVLSSENKAYLATLEDTAAVNLAGVRIYACHALSRHSESGSEKYLIDLGDLELRFAGHDLVLFGHTHFPLTCYGREAILLNPGSCGFPVDVARLPSYALFDTDRRQVELKRFDFDRDGLMRDIERFRYPRKLHDYISRNFVWG
jgi:putative phosphoesterase